MKKEQLIMKWFYNLKIAAKLIIAFIIVALITGVVGVVATKNFSNISSADTDLYEECTLGIEYIGEVSAYVQRLRFNSLLITVTDNEQERLETNNKIDDFIAVVDTNLNNYKAARINDEQAS
jgi:methyl-accepting chemotaxis protein